MFSMHTGGNKPKQRILPKFTAEASLNQGRNPYRIVRQPDLLTNRSDVIVPARWSGTCALLGLAFLISVDTLNPIGAAASLYAMDAEGCL
jgi:hypothetical protein